MRQKSVECSVCGDPPVTSRTIDDGAVIWQCQNHLAHHELEQYQELRAEGWQAPPPKTVH